MNLVRNDAYTSIGVPGGGLLAAWLVAALGITASGLLARAPVFVLPLSAVGLAAVTLVALVSTASGRRFARHVARAPLVWFHAWRVVPGVAFLVLYAQGALPWAFAVPGGIGDTLVALTAPIAAWAASREGKGHLAIYVVWSALGFLDLASVVWHAAAIARVDPESMRLLREFPLGLLPTFAVPLTFVAHVLAFHRARAR